MSLLEADKYSTCDCCKSYLVWSPIVKAVKALLQPVPEVLDEAAWSVFCLGFAEVAVLDLVLRANLRK